jgi:hypothetical protein
MTRGTRLQLTRAQVVDRAWAQLRAIPAPPPGAPPDAGGRPITYRLETENGGDDPSQAGCWDWSFGNRTPTADCIGLVLHCLGIDRLQPGFKGSRGEWLNCASICDDADGARVFFEPIAIDQAIEGDVIISRGKDGGHGHIAVIVRRACRWKVGDRVETSPPLVIDCSRRHEDQLGHEGVGLGTPWSTSCRAVRYRGLAAA